MFSRRSFSFSFFGATTPLLFHSYYIVYIQYRRLLSFLHNSGSVLARFPKLNHTLIQPSWVPEVGVHSSSHTFVGISRSALQGLNIATAEEDGHLSVHVVFPFFFSQCIQDEIPSPGEAYRLVSSLPDSFRLHLNWVFNSAVRHCSIASSFR